MGVNANLGQANVAIRATMDQLDKDLGKARGQVGGAIGDIVKGAGKSFQMLGNVALGGIGVATGAIAGVAAGLANVAIGAAPVEGIKNAFDGLADSAGVGGDAMIKALQQGSAGMISQRDLMMQFNKAAQLVGQDFAVQLPDAMQYLSKVSAATGQDMSFMMDSLVTGVGRMSPMILDNLGIQVTLAQATERAAEMYGVEADELSKAQQQAGMMNVVLEKLADNTASMPDVTESAAAKMAQFKARIQDTKDQIGMAMLPVLGTLMDTFAMLADTVLPPLMNFLEGKLAPALSTVADEISFFIASILDGHGVIDTLRVQLEALGFEDLAAGVGNVVAKVRELWAQIQPVVAQIAAWISENVKLQDVLIALGAAVAVAVAMLVGPLLVGVAQVVAIFAVVTAALAGLRLAWESDFLGIRTSLTTFWENTARPALQTLIEWLQTNIPVAIQKTADYFTSTWGPTLKEAAKFITGTVVPAIETLVEWLKEHIPDAVATAKDVLLGIVSTFQDIDAAIQGAVDWVVKFIDKIKNIKLPDFLQRHSIPPLAQTFVDIAEAAEQLTRVWPQQLQARALVSSTAMGGGGAAFHGDINIYGATDPDATAAAVIRALQNRGMLPQTMLR